ncbi:MAG TPA: hypothetical protein VIH03_06535, partial [Nitrososphaerales archaeon]
MKLKDVCKNNKPLLSINHSFTLDAVICCQYDEDAQRIRKTLGKRLEKYKLQLNEEKTKLVAFDKKAVA